MGWDAAQLDACGAHIDQMPVINPPGQALGDVQGRKNCVLEGGSVDAFAEQLVAGAGEVGDVLVILGTTLIVWTVVPEQVDIPNYYAMPNLTGGTFFVGGPSNAGGLFLKLGDPAARRRRGAGRSRRVCRCGCRTRGASGCRCRIPTGGDSSSTSISRTAPRRRGEPRSEATAFATRRMIERRAGHAAPASSRPAARTRARRVGSRRLADCTGLPVCTCRANSRRRCARGRHSSRGSRAASRRR